MDVRPILLLTPKAGYRIEPFLDAAARLGVPIRIGSDRCHQLAAHWGVPLALDFRHPERAVAQIVAYAEAEPFAALVATDDGSTVIAAAAAAALGLAANPPEAASAARNKATMRRRLADAGVPGPRWQVLAADDPLEAYRRAAVELGPSVVLKPLLMAASRGVIRADGPAEVAAALARVRRILRAPDVEPSDDPAAAQLLIEAYVPGREFAVEAMLGPDGLHPLAIFDKPDPLEGPYFEETLYVTPSRLPPADQAQLIATSAAAARALGLVRGPVHAEIRLSPTGPQVIEVAGRSIGGLCSRTVELSTGLSLEELILLDALGRTPSLEARSHGAAGVLMLPIPARGLLREVAGVATAGAIDGIESIRITAPLDHEILPLPEGASYLGFVFATGQEPAAVEAALRAAGRTIVARIVPNLVVRE